MLIAGIILIALGLVGLVLMTLFILKRRKGKTKEENTPKEVAKDAGKYESLPLALILIGIVLLCVQGCTPTRNSIKHEINEKVVAVAATQDGSGIPNNISLKTEMKTTPSEINPYRASFEPSMDRHEKVVTVYAVSLVQTVDEVEKVVQPADIKEDLKMNISLKMDDYSLEKGFKLLHYRPNKTIDVYQNSELGESEHTYALDEEGFATFEVSDVNLFGAITAKETEERSYNVTWKNYDGTVLKIDEDVLYGVTPSYSGETPTKPRTPQYSYTFDKWEPEITKVTKDVTYTASFTETVNKYKITWKNSTGETLATEDVPYGTVPEYKGATPTIPSTAQYTYTWKHAWNPSPVAVTGDATYTAVYESSVNNYTVTWKNADGTVIKTDSNIPYGTMPAYEGATPTKAQDAQYSYTFKEWSPEIVSVTGNATYTATYDATLRSYTVTWKNHDGTTLETDTDVPYGTTPTYDGATPTKTKTAQYTYAFSGWSPAVKGITGNTTYTATFDSTLRNYTVTWKNHDGTVLETDADVPYGTTPTYDGSTPTRSGYQFSGWSPSVDSVTGDATYTAQFVQTFTLTFNVPSGGTSVSSQSVAQGGKFTRPSNPTNSNSFLTFDDWYADSACTTLFNFNQTVNGNKTAYGNFVPNLQYDLIDSNSHYSVKAKSGVTLPSTLTIPKAYKGKAVTAIGEAGFKNNQTIQSLVLQEGLVKIDKEGFANCDSLTSSVTIPSTVTTLGEDAFYSCGGLTTLTFAADSKLNYIGETAFCGAAIKNISLPASVKTLAPKVFYNCPSLETATFASGCTATLDRLVFGASNALKSVTIAKGMVLGESTFYSTFALTTLTFLGTTAEFNTAKASYHSNWRSGMYLGTVTCSNGTVSL